MRQIGRRARFTFIVPYPPGGSTDVAARVVAEALTRVLAQQFVVENKSGAGGNHRQPSRCAGRAGRLYNSGRNRFIASSPHIFKMDSDPLKSLVPVIEISRQPVVLAVHPSLGVSTLAEFTTLAKKQPGLNFATSGVGSEQQMVAEWFAKLAGIKLVHVPYRGGGQAITDLVAGHIKVGSLGSTPLIPHYKAGALRLLAQSTAQRSPSLPDVPTYQEAGVKGLVLDQWFGIFVPAGTPPDIVARLAKETDRALHESSVRDTLLKSAQEPIGGTTEQFAKLVRTDYEKYANLVKELGISVGQ